jgi:hypothetical protein
MELATGWSVERVIDALVSQNRSQGRTDLAAFVMARYEHRFFKPISILEAEAVRGIRWPKGNPDPDEPIRPYGFAIMSLACQLVETLESYRKGIPTTSKDDFGWIEKDPRYKDRPTQVTCEETDIGGTENAFESFFSVYSHVFPDMSGEQFFRKVRNALLHQSQTRDGWIVNIHHPEEAASKSSEVYDGKILYRDSFVTQLRSCFASFIQSLRDHADNDKTWKNPERKIWWIAWLSDPDFLVNWAKLNIQDRETKAD